MICFPYSVVDAKRRLQLAAHKQPGRGKKKLCGQKKTALNRFYGIRALIPATSRLNVAKYANLVSLLQTNELPGNYRSLFRSS